MSQPKKQQNNQQPKKPAINHPDHYMPGVFEAINVIEAWDLNFCLGNVVKYVARAGKKDPTKEIEDLKKAAWYLNRHIETLTLERDSTLAEISKEDVVMMRFKK